MGFSNERMRTGQLVNWFLLDGLELTPAGYPVTQALSLPFGVDHLIGFNELLTCKHPENAGVHFFLDDYQFERFWRMPERYLYTLEKCPLVIGPDFSLYTDFPAPIQHWNHYRNQLLTAWLQHNGVCAIPTASWSDEDSFRWCFDGISKGGAVAVSTVGCLVHKDALQGLLRGVAEHPTMKPVVLCGRLIKNSSLPGQTVLDLFGGSGSTLIACEQLSRKCYTMEYDPRYVDVIVQRWEDFTGEKAVRLK